MPAKPGKTRRQPTAEGTSAGGGETEEETEEKRKKRRDKRRENVSSYAITFGNHIHILCTLSLIFIFLFLLYTVRLILSEFQEPSASLWVRTSPNREAQTICS